MRVKCDQDGIRKAYAVVKKGGLVVFPTDTIYGLGCDPRNANAVKRIFKIKKRITSKQLPVLAYSKKEIEKIAILDDLSNKIANRFWPGQITLVLRVKDNKIKTAMNLQEKIAVRIPNHSCTLAILKKCKVLVGTSANVSGQPTFSDPKIIQENFTGYDILLDGGKISNQTSSTIVEIVNGNLRILREGNISKGELEALI